MPRDLTARSQKDNPLNYEYRTATDLSQPQLNWTNATDKINETVGQIQGDRQRRRDETNQYTNESLDALSAATEYDNVNYNQNVMEMGYQGSDLLYGYYNQIGKNGYTQRQYKADVQSVLDGMSAVSDVYTNIETYYTDITDRTEANTNNIFEQYLGNSLLGYTNAGNFRPMFDPNGNVVMVQNRYDENGKLLPPSLEDRDATQSVNTMRVKMDQRSDYQNVPNNAAPLIEKLGTMIDVQIGSGQSALSIEDWTRKEYKDPITGETITNDIFLNNLVTELTQSPDSKISILQTYYGYGEENFTEDPDVAARDKSKVLVQRNPNRSGMSVMVFNEEQEEQIKQTGKEILLSGIDYEEKFTKGLAPTRGGGSTEAGRTAGLKADQATSFLGYLVDFVEGNSDVSNRAKTNISGDYNQGKRVGDKYLTTLNRTENSDGSVNFEIGFSDRTSTSFSNVDSQGNIIPEIEIIEQLFNNLKLSGNNTTFGSASSGVAMTGGYGLGSALSGLPQIVPETEDAEKIEAPDYFSEVIYQVDKDNFFQGSPVEYLRMAKNNEGVFEGVDIKTSQDNLLEQLMPDDLKDRIAGIFEVINNPFGGGVIQIGRSGFQFSDSAESQFEAMKKAINAEIRRLNAGNTQSNTTRENQQEYNPVPLPGGN
jgi:hypothetical protein